jgi:hypothetical protein
LVSGHCWLKMDGVSDAVRLEAGDFIALPHERRSASQATSKTSCRSSFRHQGASKRAHFLLAGRSDLKLRLTAEAVINIELGNRTTV